jgi:3-deoxy-D-arabino-heptulosonate 7-phosphate (DAHP) synthase class II
VWIGERTRELDGAHVEFCRGMKNPVGVKVSDKCAPEELLALLDAVNPGATPWNALRAALANTCCYLINFEIQKKLK